MSIKLRLLLLVLVAALPVFLLTAWYGVSERQQSKEEAEEQLLRSARLLAAQQGQFFLRAESILSAMLAAVSDRWQDTPACNAYLIRLARQNPAYTGFGIATPDGLLVCSSLPERMLGANLADRDYFQNLLATRSFSIGRVQVGVSSGQVIAGLGMPLLDDAGDVELVGVSGLNLIGLSDTIAEAVSSPGVAIVFDSTGTIIARAPEQWIGETVTPRQLELARAGGGVAEFEGAEGDRRLWAVSPLLPRAGIYAGLGMPVSEALARANTLLLWHLGLLCLVFTAAGLAAAFFGERAIRRPLEALEAAVGRMRGGDLSVRSANVGSVPEFVRLGRSFNEMAERLQAHEQELAELASQRELLVREMNHRVKNSLQLVSALLGIQRSAAGDEGVKAQLADAQARIAAIAKVHERLYSTERLDRVDAGRYLQELCSDLAESTGLLAEGGSISCRADDFILPPDQAIPLGIVATELATNAIKHAYPDEPARVEVELAASRDGWRLSVSDRGVGIPEGFEADGHPGLGMKVVLAMSRQLGARMQVKRRKRGTVFSVTLPAPGVSAERSEPVRTPGESPMSP